MIDTHIHVVPPELPGVGPLSQTLRLPVQERARVLAREMRESGTVAALAMGALSHSPDDPLGITETLAVAKLVPNLFAIGIMNPFRADIEHMRRVDKVLAAGQVKALKGYLGYLHFAPDHPNYRPYYEIAAKYRIPVIFHTGDTYSPYAKVRFAHPLGVDEVAVDHPQTKFVIAHVGNPWTLDAAEVIYKNMNVWADLSGLVVGDSEAFQAIENQAGLSDLRTRLQQAFRYAERPNRWVYGTDWPLAGMRLYRDFIASVIPQEFHEQVFVENARTLFQLGDEV